MPKATFQKKKNRSVKRRSLNKGASGGIELLLIQTVEHLGKQGEIVEVKPGYAYNYLMPQGLATMVSEHHKRMIEKHKAKLNEIQKLRLASLMEIADKIAQQSLTIEANANDEGHLYGSVGAPEIASTLKTAGFEVTADQIKLAGPLKELGLYTVKVSLGHDIMADLKVWVVPAVGEEGAE